MAKTVAETIKEITRRHLEENHSLLFGQAITAVGWVNNTVPNCRNIVELPMSDVSNMLRGSSNPGTNLGKSEGME